MNSRINSFLLLVISTIFFGFIFQELLQVDEITLNSLAELLTQEQIAETLNFQQKW